MTWEIPLAVVCAVLLLGVATCQLARSVANWFAGTGWWWPSPDKLVTSLPALFSGNASAGLPAIHHAANSGALWGWLTGVSVLTAIGLTVAGFWVSRRWGPRRMRGMATITEAHELLGLERLWKVRHLVRPDIYTAGRKANP